ncbi:MAG: response regulator [Kiritimatiellae bacterium]|nr:response regulator [Kiritimatiellia bacterium]
MAYNVLVCDDSAVIRAVIVKTLEIAKVPTGQVFQARNGKEALAVLAEQWIDVVFADLSMPEMTGLELVEKMAEDGLLKTVPVIIVSTDRSPKRIAALKAKGVRGYLTKPFTPESIKSAVDEVLGDKPA